MSVMLAVMCPATFSRASYPAPADAVGDVTIAILAIALALAQPALSGEAGYASALRGWVMHPETDWLAPTGFYGLLWGSWKTAG